MGKIIFVTGFIASSFGTGSFNPFLKADVQDRRRKLRIIYLRGCVNWKYVAQFLNKNSEILLKLVSCEMCYQVGYNNIPGIDSSWQIKCLFLLDTSKCHPLLRHFM